MGGQETLSLDELHITKVGSGISNKHGVMFSFFDKAKPRTALVKLPEGQVRFIEDPRMKVFVPFVADHSGGFALVSRVGTQMVYWLDEKGDYKESYPLAGFEGWKKGSSLEYLFQQSESLYLGQCLTQDGKTIELIWLDFDQRTCTSIGTHSKEPNIDPVFLPSEKGILRVERQSGSVTLWSSGLESLEKVIRQPADFHPAERMRSTRSSIYQAYFGLPLRYVNQHLYLYYHDLNGDFGDPEASFTLALPLDGKPEKLSTFPIGESNGIRLIWNWYEEELSMEKEF